MNLSSLDLNLMIALDALLRERNVTRAAERLQLTQSTLSATLGRLRRHFDDELLHRVGNHLEVTALGTRLAPMVATALSETDRLFSARSNASVAQSARQFRIVASDYGVTVSGAPWSATVASLAPRVRFHFLNSSPGNMLPAETRTRDIDAIIAPHGFLPEDLPHIDLFADRWVIVTDRTNDSIGQRVSLEQLRRLDWAVTSNDPRETPAGLRQTEWASIESRIQIAVESFTGIPSCLIGTERVALMQEKLVYATGADARLKIVPSPFDAAPIVEALWWHPVYTNDPEHEWIRSKVGVSAPEVEVLSSGA